MRPARESTKLRVSHARKFASTSAPTRLTSCTPALRPRAFLEERASACPGRVAACSSRPTPFLPEIFTVFAMTEKIIPSPVRSVNEILLRNIFYISFLREWPWGRMVDLRWI